MFDKRVCFDRLLFLHNVTSDNEITMWKKWLKTLRKELVHNIRAREENKKCCESSSKQILIVVVSSERERWLYIRKNQHMRK